MFRRSEDEDAPPAKVAEGEVINIWRDGTWCPGVVMTVTPTRLVVAVCGNRQHRAYIARIQSAFRRVTNSPTTGHTRRIRRAALDNYERTK